MRKPGRRMATKSNMDSKKRRRSSAGWSPPACSEAIGGGDAGRCRPLMSGSSDGGGGGGGGVRLGPATGEGVSGSAGSGGSREGGGSCWPRAAAPAVRTGSGGGGRWAEAAPSAGSAAGRAPDGLGPEGDGHEGPTPEKDASIGRRTWRRPVVRQLRGCTTTSSTGAGRERPMRTSPISTPKKSTFWSVRSLSQSRPRRNSSWNRGATQMTTAASRPEAWTIIWPSWLWSVASRRFSITMGRPVASAPSTLKAPVSTLTSRSRGVMSIPRVSESRSMFWRNHGVRSGSCSPQNDLRSSRSSRPRPSRSISVLAAIALLPIAPHVRRAVVPRPARASSNQSSRPYRRARARKVAAGQRWAGRDPEPQLTWVDGAMLGPLAQVGHDHRPRPSRVAPLQDDQPPLGVDPGGGQVASAVAERRDLAAQPQQRPPQLQGRPAGPVPVELGPLEGGRVVGVGHPGPPLEGGELGPPALPHRLGQGRPVVGEVEERPGLTPLLTLEEQGDRKSTRL